ncbi:DNA-binding protein [Coleofasciculus sp. FACHB-712]|uniref:DNA-binding protein n=1 Tax=Coleofasciculus sp. FACHB-712 TaxID=2692789 RepID=UPI00168467D6|nr:DNA-binding protein [Coleofasciculus sp. FACHB-712]MBD1945615.1 DNA-binding protein [Coleofasciculus sp. FACHB-712]
MHTITITIPDDHLVKLQETATRLGISLEELILMGVEEILNQPEQTLQSAVDYVLKKNAELYKRLA